METVDLNIIIVYLGLMTLVGLWASKKAKSSTDEYFLGGRSMPWWLLGISGMASFVDVGGTALVSGILYFLGMKGLFFMWNGHIALLLSFQMIYVAKWLRRSECSTNAEWMVKRFGVGRPGNAARVASAIGALAIALAFMVYFWKGAGVVLAEYIPFFEGQEDFAAFCFFALVAIYTVSSGFHGVVYTDFFQSFLILFLIIYVAVCALMTGTPEYFAQHAPEGWLNLTGDPADSQPRDYSAVDSAKSLLEQVGMLLPLLGLWIFKNVLEGASTPFDAWTAQRYYAAKNEREASLVSAQWISLTSLRWLLLAGIAVLALPYASQIADPEKALSVVLKDILPIGISGLMLAALLSAGMSTVDSTVNSCAAYYVKDIYKPFINPQASEKRLTTVSLIVSFLILAIGGFLGTFASSINAIWDWILAGLFVGTLVPNVLKWFWWRFNGWGFAGGCIAGFIGALFTLFDFIKPVQDSFGSIHPYLANTTFFNFSFILLISILGTIVVTRMTRPPNMDELVDFYKKTRPFGFWGPVRDEIAKTQPEIVAEAKTEGTRDLCLLPVAALWHFSLFTIWPCLIFKQWDIVLYAGISIVVTSFILYHIWYKNLKKA